MHKASITKLKCIAYCYKTNIKGEYSNLYSSVFTISNKVDDYKLIRLCVDMHRFSLGQQAQVGLLTEQIDKQITEREKSSERAYS